MAPWILGKHLDCNEQAPETKVQVCCKEQTHIAFTGFFIIIFPHRCNFCHKRRSLFGYGLSDSLDKSKEMAAHKPTNNSCSSGDIWVNDLKYRQIWLVLLIFGDIDGPYRKAAKVLMSTEMPSVKSVLLLWLVVASTGKCLSTYWQMEEEMVRMSTLAAHSSFFYSLLWTEKTNWWGAAFPLILLFF